MSKSIVSRESVLSWGIILLIVSVIVVFALMAYRNSSESFIQDDQLILSYSDSDDDYEDINPNDSQDSSQVRTTIQPANNNIIIEKYSSFNEDTMEENTNKVSASNDDLFSMLNQVNATLYVADNCTYCSQQAEILGETKDTLKKKINVVNCVVNGVFQDACKSQELEGFPTWKCNNNTYIGAKSVKELNAIVAQNS